MFQPHQTARTKAQAEHRPGVVVSARTWLPTAEQLQALEATWAPIDAHNANVRGAASSPLDESHA